LFNLVSNAIKYNKSGGLVTIYYENDDCGIRVVVEDNGIGIETENLEIIFNRFKRMDVNKEEGQGLGLSIVNSIASFHEAKIEVKSKIGEGSQFKICFLLKNINYKTSPISS
jgi:two-component system phosphate regulon sensor histidine kinase PhoR